MAREQRGRKRRRRRKRQGAEKTNEHSNRSVPVIRTKGGKLYVSMHIFWIWFWFLVDIPHHHDRDDDILLLHDEKTRNELLDGLLHKG